jgi:dipeptidyl aminopeptidase/acylaminoacyl peptidase
LAYFAALREYSSLRSAERIPTQSRKERKEENGVEENGRMTKRIVSHAMLFVWSPDGKRIAFISAVEETDDFQPSSSGDSNAQSTGEDPRVIDRIQYKSRTSFSDRLRTHVFVVDASMADSASVPFARQLTTGRYYDHAITWNPKGEEMYMGLKRRSVESVFVRYPREGHGLREPKHRVDALERTLAWFDRFLKP